MFSPDESKLLTDSIDGISRVWDWRSSPHRCISTYRDRNGTRLVGSFAPDGNSIVSCGDDMKRQGFIWDCTTPNGVERNVQFTGGRHANVNMSARFSPDGNRVAFCGGKYASVFDAKTGRLIAELKGHTGRVAGVEFVGDGDHLITGCNDNFIRFWDLNFPGDVKHLATNPTRSSTPI